MSRLVFGVKFKIFVGYNRGCEWFGLCWIMLDFVLDIVRLALEMIYQFVDGFDLDWKTCVGYG